MATNWINRANRPVKSWAVLATAAALLGGTDFARRWMASEAAHQRAHMVNVDRQAQHEQDGLDSLESLVDLRRKEVERMKLAIQGDAQSRKALFEEGLTLQEEKRLLEKQLEIMVTAFRVDVQTKRLVLLKGEQAVESYPAQYLPPLGFGATLPRPLRSMARVTSKERFAHPERGEVKDVNGKLEWIPPQVGTSVRANALGEYVTFTDSGLILHGPPAKPEEHAAFPHYCLGLDLATARQLYRKSFIGTRILIDKDLVAAAQTASAASLSSSSK